ncbi:MAG: bifunctional glutamate N-acetyltransferase/amino-acid acetyltransferase ArgJ [Bifidobacteriaceae bacterium]|jgi:glutamate N-acetyltransferase/amino-acid N-acetyltransferase|nr:bifunctional glutamate N-acetyltransferase/amino-acid acetyltransferase ArgJ [Bifidobacteriaceae bacterium]
MSITTPAGFRAAGVAAGLKPLGAKDVALVVNDGDPAQRSAAAVFTPNRFEAAPVRWSREALAQTTPGVVVLNSGGANACTGARGLADARATAEFAAAYLGLTPAEVLVCSTGLIGEPLPMEAVLSGVGAAIGRLTPTGGGDAALAIMTTDTRPKEAMAMGAGGYVVGGMAKGAGMLAPELATMLVVLTTDALAPDAVVGPALRAAVDASFNRIDSDGCQSTNDAVILLASGASGAVPDAAEFTDTLTMACQNLARQLIADAEGASHDIAITVARASGEAAALAVARAVARSNLVKAAVFGNDPNWGRVLAAAGTVPPGTAPYNPDSVDVWINGVQVARGGAIGEDRAAVDLTPRETAIVIDLAAGEAEATIWTNDLTTEYVHENSAYSS